MSDGTVERAREQRKLTQHVYPLFLHTPSAYGTPTTLGVAYSFWSTAFWQTRSETQSQRKVLHPGPSKWQCWQPQEAMLPFEPQFVSNVQRRWWHFNTKNKEPYHVLSHSCSFSVLASHLHWKWRYGRKGEDKAARRFFSFRQFLTQQ